MDLEVREIPIQSRAMYNSRLKSYKQEVEKLEKDFVSAFNKLKFSPDDNNTSSCEYTTYLNSFHTKQNLHVRHI